MKLNFNKKSKGFTLVEILLVVGFIALASIGIYAVYSKVQTSSKANEEGKNLETMRAGIKNLYGGQTNYTGLSATVVAQAKVAPLSMINVGNTLRNSFGGAVTITPVSVNGGTNNAFSITYANIPADVCVKLATASGASFDGVGPTSGTWTWKPIASGSVVNLTTVTPACSAYTGVAANTISFLSM